MGDLKATLRKSMFPDVNDWTSNHDKLRFQEDWWAMKWWYFITFHWIGTRMFLFLTCAVSFLFLLFGIGYALINHNPFIGVICFILSIVLGKATYSKGKEWKNKAKWTIYDMFLREKWL